jgi:urate oxidase
MGPIMLVQSAYGKSRIRLVQIARHGDRHDLSDLTIAIRFEGEYDESYTTGDNAGVLPTDTMKNTVYALAARHGIQEPEAFGLTLATHFLERNPRLTDVRIDVSARTWDRLRSGGPADDGDGHAFIGCGPDMRTASVGVDRTRTIIAGGVRDLLILKSSRSAFAGFLKDGFTTLPETQDRLLATSLTATWNYRPGAIDHGPVWRKVRQVLLESFAAHNSASVQHTMYAMGNAVLAEVPDVAVIHLVMPNKHHIPVDLSRFGLENRNEIFVATDEPHGLIEATIAR